MPASARQRSSSFPAGPTGDRQGRPRNAQAVQRGAASRRPAIVGAGRGGSCPPRGREFGGCVVIFTYQPFGERHIVPVAAKTPHRPCCCECCFILGPRSRQSADLAHIPDRDPNADLEPASGNARAPCGLPERVDDDRRRGTDLPDDELPVPRHPACRQLVRTGRARQHLRPHHAPDECRPRRTRRGSRGRGCRTGARFWPAALLYAIQSICPSGRQFRQLDRPLRWHLELFLNTMMKTSPTWPRRSTLLDPRLRPSGRWRRGLSGRA